jgi:uncharacterized membrane-anchored protein YitT (DUF2179 family)
MHKAYSHLNTYESWHVETGNVIVNAVFGGTSVGLGIGVIVLAGGTTAKHCIDNHIACFNMPRFC